MVAIMAASMSTGTGAILATSTVMVRTWLSWRTLPLLLGVYSPLTSVSLAVINLPLRAFDPPIPAPAGPQHLAQGAQVGDQRQQPAACGARLCHPHGRHRLRGGFLRLQPWWAERGGSNWQTGAGRAGTCAPSSLLKEAALPPKLQKPNRAASS